MTGCPILAAFFAARVGILGRPAQPKSDFL
jgi:hypothetical protein